MAMRRWIEAAVTVGYIGKIPRAPGTFGSMIPAILALFSGSQVTVAVLALVSTLAGLALAGPSARLFNDPDPPYFVLDEFAGMCVALIYLPVNLATVVGAFALFRFFDILKPLGIRRLERISHPSSVMLDDLAAGIAANLCVRLCLMLF